jgi:hypothetical protein
MASLIPSVIYVHVTLLWEGPCTSSVLAASWITAADD